jgi:hypothetical protein
MVIMYNILTLLVILLLSYYLIVNKNFPLDLLLCKFVISNPLCFVVAGPSGRAV